MNQNTKLFIYENPSENIVCEMAAILSWERRVKPCRAQINSGSIKYIDISIFAWHWDGAGGCYSFSWKTRTLSSYIVNTIANPGPLFAKRLDVLPLNFAKSASCDIGCCKDRIALKFDRHLGSVVAEVPFKFQGVWKSLNLNLVVSRLHKILR